MSQKNDRHDRAQQRAVSQQPTVQISRSLTQYSGLLPPPDDLAKYEQTLPGSAERMLAAVEAEANHRRAIEREQADAAGYAIRHELADRRAGLWIGGVITLACLGLGALSLYLGHPLTAGAIVVVDVVALATIFVTGRSIQANREREPAPTSRQLPE